MSATTRLLAATQRIPFAMAMLVFTAPAVDAQSQHTHDAPPVTSADREAAFPDLGDMNMAAMMAEDPLNRFMLLDRFEAQDGDDGEILNWDFQGWIGGSASRLWIRSEGARDSGTTEQAELQLLWGHPIARPAGRYRH